MSSFSFPSRRICSETVYIGARLDEKRKKKKRRKRTTRTMGPVKDIIAMFRIGVSKKKGLRGRGAEAR